jgi:hypothetical protein
MITTLPTTPVMEDPDTMPSEPHTSPPRSGVKKPRSRQHRKFYSSPSQASDYFSSDDIEQKLTTNEDVTSHHTSPEMASSLRSSFNEGSSATYRFVNPFSQSLYEPSTTSRAAFFPAKRIATNLSWAEQKSLDARMENIRADVALAGTLSAHQVREMNRAFDRIDELFSAPDTQTREPAESAGGSELFMDDEDQAEEQTVLDDELRRKDDMMKDTVDRVLSAARKLQRQCIALRESHAVAQQAIVDATDRIEVFVDENQELLNEVETLRFSLAETKLELARLQREVDTNPNATAELLPKGVLLDSVLDKLDRDMEELSERRYSELMSGSHTPLISPTASQLVSPLRIISDISESNRSHAENDDIAEESQNDEVLDTILTSGTIDTTGNGLNGSVHSLNGIATNGTSTRSLKSSSSQKSVKSHSSTPTLGKKKKPETVLQSDLLPQPASSTSSKGKSAWSQFFDGLAILSGFNDPDD